MTPASGVPDASAVDARLESRTGGYVGRFAPSPSGPLHFGSLVAAVGSYLDARAHGGRWLVRIEDLDPPREQPGAADDILRTLETLCLRWDGTVMRQSERADAYAGALSRLEARDLVQACRCTRSTLAALPENAGREPGANDDLYHPAQCPPPPGREPGAPGTAQRLRVTSGLIPFVDRSLGPQSWDVAATVGNFVLRRRDGWYAYQLAVVIDDADQGVTDVVRGWDLLSSTPRQVLLQRALGLPTVRYLHLPLAVDGRGRKLSKSEDAPAVARAGDGASLAAVLEFLGQAPPPELHAAAPGEVLAWAREHWQVQGFAGRTTGSASRTATVGDGGEGTT